MEPMEPVIENIQQLGAAFIAADHEMRDAVARDPDECASTSLTHQRCDSMQNRVAAELDALGGRVSTLYVDGEDSRLCGVEIVMGDDPPMLIGRKPDWAIEQDSRRAARAEAALAAEAQREAAALAAIGMTLDDVRAAIGRLATHEQWSLWQCASAARARLQIIDGADAASIWCVALYGRADEHAVHCIAVQGVGGAIDARERWRAKSDALARIGGAGGRH